VVDEAEPQAAAAARAVRPAGATSLQRRLRRWLPPIVLFAVVAVVWEVGAGASDNILLPTFTRTVAALGDLLIGGEIWEPLWVSNQTMIVGFLIASALAIPSGLIMGRIGTIDRAANPWVSILVVLPQAPLLPILVMMVGLNFAAAVLLVIAFVFVYVVINTRAGIRNIDRGLIEMAVSFGAREREIWRDILIPGALPAIATGLRIGLGRAFAGMILGELLLLSRGVGVVVLQYRGTFRADYLFATVAVLLIEAVAIGVIMRRVEAAMSR
jgi:ABC-type nitrate/sulfonate/bicarbonate transport system permease component